jgi:DNA-binding transcriptional MocR family regulator
MIEQKYITGRSAVNIARSIEQAVAQGRASAGDPLPPIRGLAAHLGVALATVASAYRILQDRGVTVAFGRRGTRIRPTPPASALPRMELPRGVRNLSEGNPDRALLPNLQRAVRKADAKQRLYGEEFRDRSLVALARRQFRADGVPAKDIAIVSGALDGIERVLRERLRGGDRVFVEDPCFSGILDLLASMGLVPVPVPVDDEGLRPQALRGHAAALIVTPRAQNPTGAAISKRRARLIRAALRKRPELFVIEDDHAGPVAGVPYVTLIDRDREHWAVVRSVSKYLGPDLRVAMMAGDAATISGVERRQGIGMRWVSHILQNVVAALWRDPALKAAEKAYTSRRTALLRALEKYGIEAHGRSGLNVWIPVAEESAVVQALMRRGWAVKAGERYRLQSAPAIRVTIATLTETRRFASDLASVLQGWAEAPPSVSA